MKAFIVSVVLLLSFALAQESLSLSDQELERSYSIYVPKDDSVSTPMPLVLILHGRGQSASSMIRLTNFNNLADTFHFIAVYPNGIDAQWNYVKDIPGYPVSVDDTTFLLHLIDQIAKTYSVDRSRLYVTGFSNGGFMTERLACDVPEVFAGFASVGAAGFGGMPGVCEHDIPVSLLLMHGTLDRVVPWNGFNRRNSAGVDVLVLADVPRTLAYWAKHSGCSNETEKRSFSQMNEETSVSQLTVLGCPEGTETTLYTISGGGHNWPGSPGLLPEEIAGSVSTDISASEEIWNFFNRHQR